MKKNDAIPTFPTAALNVCPFPIGIAGGRNDIFLALTAITTIPPITNAIITRK